MATDGNDNDSDILDGQRKKVVDATIQIGEVFDNTLDGLRSIFAANGAAIDEPQLIMALVYVLSMRGGAYIRTPERPPAERFRSREERMLSIRGLIETVLFHVWSQAVERDPSAHMQGALDRQMDDLLKYAQSQGLTRQ